MMKSAAGAVPNPLKICSAMSVAGAVVMAMVGAAALLGWALDVEVLKRGPANLVAMNPATAVAFILAGASLAIAHRTAAKRFTGAGKAAAAVVALMGVVKLLGDTAGRDVGFDHWLFSSAVDLDPAGVNRMAPNTAVCFALLGAALLGMHGRSARSHARGQLLAIGGGMLALLAMIGYSYRIGSLYGVASFIPMALNTAAAFLVGFIAVLFARPSSALMVIVTSTGSSGVLARRLLPAVIIVPALLGWGRLIGERQGLFSLETGVLLMVLVTIVLLTALVWWHSAMLYRADQRRQQDEASLQRLASIVEHTDDAIISETLDGRIQSWNAAAERLFGYSAAEMIGTWTAKLIPSDRPDELPNLIDRLQGGERIENYETVRVTSEGQWLDVSLTLSPVKDRSGKIIGVSKIVRDITARKAAQAELERARRAAEAANRAKSEFLANMSHEIRTPLSAVIGYADLLLNPAHTLSDRFNYVSAIRDNAEHLLTIINDILDLSKIEAGEMHLERIACWPCQILSDVASVMRVKAVNEGLTLEISAGPRIPETIQSDPTRLRQILINLVGNAVKFTSHGSVRVGMQLVEPRGGDAAVLEFKVTDTGIGMDPTQLARLFHPFCQGDSTVTRRFGGTGLGLTISRRLARMLGGDITVQSSPGSGSVFTLTVDAGSLEGVEMLADCSEARVSRQRAEPPDAVSSSLSGHVLLVDDGIHNQRVIAAYLRQAGAEVMIADNGRTGCEMVAEAVENSRPFDVVLMDMQMPEMDGYAATAKLRREGYNLPIIALTAHAMAGDREKCLNHGCTDYLSKPVNPAALMQMLARYLHTAPSSKTPAAGAVLRSTSMDQVIQPLLPDYVADLPRKVEVLTAQMAAGDLARVKATAHDLKGTGGLYGFMLISEQAARVEDAIAAGAGIHAIRAHVDELIAVLRRVEGYGQDSQTQS